MVMENMEVSKYFKAVSSSWARKVMEFYIISAYKFIKLNLNAQL